MNLKQLRTIVDEARWTCKRNFKQPDHASAVTEQTEDLVFIHIHVHLVRPARGTSHRIMPAKLLNRRRISSSSIHPSEWTLGKLSRFYEYISSDLQEENSHRIISAQLTEQTEDLIFIHITSRRTCKRNFSQDHASAVTEQTEDLIFIHIHLIGPARGTSHRIMTAKLLNRPRISYSSISKE